MSTFINFNFDNAINKQYLILHIKFLFLWVLGIGVIFFRLDIGLVNLIPNKLYWINHLFPLVVVLVFFLVLRDLKWYFWLAFVFYIPLMVFWFLPKFILQKGKFYLFICYLSMVINRIRKWKSTIIHLLVFVLLAFLVSNVHTDFVRAICVIFALYLLLKYNFKYIKQSIRPASLLGDEARERIQKLGRDNDKYKTLQTLMDNVKGKDMTDQELEVKRLEQLALYHAVCYFFKQNLSSTRGRSAFSLYWLITFFLSITVTLILLTFVNYQIYHINNSAFETIEPVNFFEFFRYTTKQLTFGDIEQIRPNSILTKVIEIGAFLIIGILYLVILLAIGYSLVSSRIEEDKEIIVDALENQLVCIEEFSANKFGKELSLISREMESIKNSIQKIKEVFKRIF